MSCIDDSSYSRRIFECTIDVCAQVHHGNVLHTTIQSALSKPAMKHTSQSVKNLDPGLQFMNYRSLGGAIILHPNTPNSL